MRTVSGSSAERCSRVRTAWIVSVSRTRQVEATARSMPTTTAATATAAARSPSVRIGGADDEARRKSRNSAPCAVRRTVSGLRAPWEIPALRSTSTERRKPSTSSSLTSSPSSCENRRPSGRPRDERGVVRRSAPPGRHDLWDLRAGVGRQEGHVRLVLHLLQAVEDECGARVPIDAEPPHLAQPLRVSGVTPVDRQLERSAPRVRAGKGRHAPLLARHGCQPVHFDLQVAHGIGHLGRRGEPVGRAHGEVAGGRRTPAHDDRGNDTEWQPVAADRPRRARRATRRRSRVGAWVGSGRAGPPVRPRSRWPAGERGSVG